MPNYRNKNRNKNKNRKKNNNQNKNPQEQQQKQQQQQEKSNEQVQEQQPNEHHHHECNEELQQANDIKTGTVSVQPPKEEHTQQSENLEAATNELSEEAENTYNNLSTSGNFNETGTSTAPSVLLNVVNESADLRRQNLNVEEMGAKSSKIRAAHSSPALEVNQPNVIIHSVQLEENVDAAVTTAVKTAPQENVKVIIHRVIVEESSNDPPQETTTGKLTSPEPPYTVESPPTVEEELQNLPLRLYDAEKQLQIQELSDLSSGEFSDNAPIISEVESETESLKALTPTHEVNPLISSPTEKKEDLVSNLSAQLQEDLKQRRVQKRVALESHFMPQLINPRYLDSIIEENSEMSDASSNPPSRVASGSDIADKAKQHANAKFPKSNLDFSKKHKHSYLPKAPTLPAAIREEPVAFMVETKLIDQPNLDESCSTLNSLLSPESEAAELVFIPSASSSLSDLLDLQDDFSVTNECSTVDLDTDVKEIIAGPSNSSGNLLSSRESTPVNQTSNLKETFTQQNHQINELLKSTQNEMNNQSVSQQEETEQQSKAINKTTATTTTTMTSQSTSSKLFSSENNSVKTISDSRNIEISSSAAAEYPKKLPTLSVNSSSVKVLEETKEIMNSVREIVNNNNIETTTTTCSSPPPPPIPPPPQHVDYNTETSTTNLKRQESYDSHCSDSTNNSQCTAINLGGPLSPACDNDATSPSYSIADTTIKPEEEPNDDDSSIKKLRLLCTETLASMPYGEDVLEELASVAQNIDQLQANQQNNMPYPQPLLPHINDLKLCLNADSTAASKQAQVKITNKFNTPSANTKEAWLGLQTEPESKVLLCLSPAQQQELKTQTNPEELLDAHQKFIERRGYHEYSREQVKALESAAEEEAEHQILQNAAIMKKLRKSLSPPPIPPPPVPIKSSETAAKAQKQTKTQTMAISASTAADTKHDASSFSNANELMAPFANGEENKHRLLVIIHDNTSEKEQQKQSNMPLSLAAGEAASLLENSSRQQINNNTAELPQSVRNTSGDQTDSTAMATAFSPSNNVFPTTKDIFDEGHRRFSSIDSYNQSPYCAQIRNTQPKRFSSFETSSFESQKRTENGKVIYDINNSSHESRHDGDKDVSLLLQHKSPPQSESKNLHSTQNAHHGNENNKNATNNVNEIMSALNLNTTTTSAKDSQQPEHPSNNLQSNLSNSNAEQQQTTQNHHQLKREYIINRQQSENTQLKKKDLSSTFEEFRQRAKRASEQLGSSSGTGNSTHFDHEKLFKDFDDLSKQLHQELEAATAEKARREKSASMYDLNKATPILRSSGEQFENFKKERHEHMRELEQEIDRSMKSRQFRMQSAANNQDTARTVEIPIQLENGNYHKANGGAAPVVYDIPIQRAQTPADSHTFYSQYDDSNRHRRAESMFNLSENAQSSSDNWQQSYQNQQQDDWSRYASDLGMSENIARPFAKEVEICYNRMRPSTIRAPRLSASTNDLSFNTQPRFDIHNAYNVRRTHAPMLSESLHSQEKSRPQYLSCSSMIERNPNPTYISTTSRRGISPAPQVSPQPTVVSPMFERPISPYYQPERQARRASLPREIHEQQLKYITSKEEELKTEFERLQNERRRLMEELNNAEVEAPPIAPPTPKRSMRPISKLPTLSENEVFRQQMAEEWLNKVAEREERRLQKIIKMSNLNEAEGREIPIEMAHDHPDIGKEFISRVKERRTKLSMPSDSDWESGAESQPVKAGHSSETDEQLPAVKIIDGKSSQADVRHLPRHLREFAQFSNHQVENIEGGKREMHQEEERRQEANENSQSSAVKKSSMVKTIKISRLPGSMVSDDSDFSQFPTTSLPTQTTDFSAFKFPRATFSSTSPQFSSAKLPPPAFGEMFQTSPFKHNIYEEFDNYWRSFSNARI